jgi:hypothetical protein
VFKDVITPKDVKKGEFRSCYFTTALKALAEVPDKVKERFVT